MPEYTLLRSQKNTILELVKQSELDPFNFGWSKELSKYTSTGAGIPVEVSRLSYIDVDTDFYFQFDFHKGEHYAIFSPGDNKLVMETYPGSWEGQLSYFRSWLTFLKREIQQPDLWVELAKYQLPPGEQISIEIANEPFTTQQVDQIAEGVEKIRKYLEVEFDLDTQQKALVNEKLKYLLEASKRQGRKDWLHTSIGVIFTIATGLALAPEQAKAIWNILKVAVSGIIQLIP
jgi:hypothetical protein